MPLIRSNRASDRRVRFVFDDAVLSFSLSADATFGEIATKMGEVSNYRLGKPVAIEVTLGRRGRGH